MKTILKKGKRGFSLLEVFIGISLLAITGVSLGHSSATSARYAYKNFYDTLINYYAGSIFNQIISMPPAVLATYVDTTAIPVYGAGSDPYVTTDLPLYERQDLGDTDFSILVDKERDIRFPVSFLVSLERTVETISGESVPLIRVSLTFEYMNTLKRKRTVGGTFFATLPG